MTGDMQDAKERVKAILQSKEAEGRRDLAEHLAFDTDMTADAAVALLTRAPLPNAAPAMSYTERRIAAANGLLRPGLDAASVAASLSGSGLAMGARGLAQPSWDRAESDGRVDIVAAMQRRHPVKSR